MREKLKTIAKNLRWLTAAEDEFNNIRAGIMHSLSQAVKAEYDFFPAPTEIWDIYSEVSEGRPRAAEFASLVSDICSLYGISEDGASKGEQRLSPGTVSYVKNPVNDKAYRLLSHRLMSQRQELTASYTADFKGACEDVYYDRAKYCLLPLENSSDGLLYAFRRLADKYELTIVAAVNIETGDEEQTTAALLSSEEFGGGDTYEIAVPSDTPWSIGELGEALSLLDASTSRINYIPSHHRDGDYDAHLCIKYDGDPTPLRLFFTSAYPTCTYYGSYKLI